MIPEAAEIQAPRQIPSVTIPVALFEKMAAVYYGSLNPRQAPPVGPSNPVLPSEDDEPEVQKLSDLQQEERPVGPHLVPRGVAVQQNKTRVVPAAARKSSAPEHNSTS